MSDYAKIVYPRITKGYAKSLIAQEQIVVNAEMCVVICIVRLKNGHRLVTDAIVANSGMFDATRSSKQPCGRIPLTCIKPLLKL